MKRFWRDGESGQALIQVSFALIVLLGFTALAVDLSFGYAERRNMQNAADAGALAGAYDICFGDPTRSSSQIASDAQALAVDYATVQNHAQTANATVVNNWITVTAQITTPTWFASIIGFSQQSAAASAVSACGRANAACGLIPVGFNRTLWNNLTTQGCGQPVIFWADTPTPDCTAHVCEWIWDETDSVWYNVPLVYGDREWVDFSNVLPDGGTDYCDKAGCSSAEVVARVEGEDKINGVTRQCRNYGELGGCAANASSQGTAESSRQALAELRGETRPFPLWDGPCDAGEGGSGSDGCGVGGWELSSFGCVTILTDANLCKSDYVTFDGSGVPIGGPSQKCTSGPKVVVGRIECNNPACANVCGTTDGTPAGPGELKAVGLIQ